MLLTEMRLKIKMRIFLTTNMMLLKKNVTLKRRMLIFLTKKLEDDILLKNILLFSFQFCFVRTRHWTLVKFGENELNDMYCIIVLEDIIDGIMYFLLSYSAC